VRRRRPAAWAGADRGRPARSPRRCRGTRPSRPRRSTGKEHVTGGEIAEGFGAIGGGAVAPRDCGEKRCWPRLPGTPALLRLSGNHRAAPAQAGPPLVIIPGIDSRHPAASRSSFTGTLDGDNSARVSPLTPLAVSVAAQAPQAYLGRRTPCREGFAVPAESRPRPRPPHPDQACPATPGTNCGDCTLESRTPSCLAPAYLSQVSGRSRSSSRSSLPFSRRPVKWHGATAAAAGIRIQLIGR
jgi:hypothetical protein